MDAPKRVDAAKQVDAAYVERVDALTRAAERRAAKAELITHRIRAGDGVGPDDPAWAALASALDDEDEARGAMRAFLANRLGQRDG